MPGLPSLCMTPDNATTSTTKTYTLSTTAGNTVFVCGFVEHATADPPDIAINDTAGWTWTMCIPGGVQALYATGANPRMKMAVWRAVSDGSSNDVTVSCTGTNAIGMLAYQFSGNVVVDAVNYAVGANASGDPSGSYINPLASDSLVISLCQSAQNNTHNTGAPFTGVIGTGTWSYGNNQGRVSLVYNDSASPSQGPYSYTSSNNHTYFFALEYKDGVVDTPVNVDITVATAVVAAKAVTKLASIATSAAVSARKAMTKNPSIAVTTATTARKATAKRASISVATSVTAQTVKSVVRNISIGITTAVSALKAVTKRPAISVTTTVSQRKSILKTIAVALTAAVTNTPSFLRTVYIQIALTTTVSARKAMTKLISVPLSILVDVSKAIPTAVINISISIATSVSSWKAIEKRFQVPVFFLAMVQYIKQLPQAFPWTKQAPAAGAWGDANTEDELWVRVDPPSRFEE